MSGRNECVSWRTRALETSFCVGTQLITVTPLLAFIQIDACPFVGGVDGHPGVTVTDTSFKRSLAFEGTVEGFTQLI